MTAQSDYSVDMAIGYAGMLRQGESADVITMRNDEASAELEFGYAVKRDDSNPTDPHAAMKLTAITGEVVPGIVLHSHAYDETQLGDDGILPDQKLSVLQRGCVLVVCEDGCNPGDRLHIRAVAAGNEIAGALRSSADGTDTIDSTGQGVWQSYAAAGGLAWLRVDFINPLT